MEKKISIKNMYSDALYWATSTQTKNEGYHLTRTQEVILRKLIHYSRKNETITYSNSIISKHTFIGEETIRKAIPRIAKKSWISTAAIKIVDGGEVKTRRTIFIQWDFIQKVLDDIPKQQDAEKLKASGETPSIAEIHEGKETPKLQELDSHMLDSDLTSTLTTSGIYEVPEVVITDDKLKWLKELSKNQSLTKEQVKDMGQDILEEIFYNGTGIWRINKDSMENKYRIKYTCRGGSLGKLYDKNKVNDRIEINVNDFSYYLNQKGIEFNVFTPKMYRDIKAFGLVKAPKVG